MARRNLIKAIGPLNIYGNVIGFNVFKYDFDSDRFVLNPTAIVTNLTVLTLLAYVVAEVVKTTDLARLEDYSFSDASGLTDLILGSSIYLVGNVANALNVKRFDVFVETIAVIDKRWRHVVELSNFDRRYVRLTSFGLTLIVVEFLLTLSTDYWFFVVDESFSYLFTSYFPILGNGCVKLYYVVTVTFVYDRVVLVNRFLTPSNVKNWRSLDVFYTNFVDLCDTFRAINRLYGFQLLLVIGVAFNVCTAQFYYCFTVAYDKTSNLTVTDTIDVCMSFQWGVFQLLELYLIVRVSVNLQNEVSFFFVSRSP